jgi:hypothetical protein
VISGSSPTDIQVSTVVTYMNQLLVTGVIVWKNEKILRNVTKKGWDNKNLLPLWC